MRLMHQALQVLVLCQFALASPCKPSATSVSSALTTSVTESSASAILTTESVTISATTSIEPSTTASSGPQQPTNLLRNSGFEEDAIAPWDLSSYFGSISLSAPDVHSGSQSGYMTGAPGGTASLGFKQPLDSSLIEVDKTYKFSAWVKVTERSNCFGQWVSCGTGRAVFGQTAFGGSLDTWTFVTTTCSWSQDRLNAGASVHVSGTCDRMSFYLDDAVLIEVV
ncbi:hypothetical protein FHETE_7125 [Fusarium heterosporum]|uniref:CBM-cenC domain-containing protein n=1 Tax=Fusarium heterosporum TaxID=42747 RepID=A0A8H5T715_FUSHE|nr:hypothetical protein FHETE_7125 [Fusarium heterosporum]